MATPSDSTPLPVYGIVDGVDKSVPITAENLSLLSDEQVFIQSMSGDPEMIREWTRRFNALRAEQKKNAPKTDGEAAQ